MSKAIVRPAVATAVVLIACCGCSRLLYSYRNVVTRCCGGEWSSHLIMAAEEGDLRTVRSIIRSGKTDLDWRPSPGYGNALEAAVGGNHYEIAEELLRHGADPNGGAVSTWNPLSIACGGNEFRDMVDLLLRYGADPNFRHGDGMYPILDCTSIPILEALLKAGGNLGLAYETTGVTLLMGAVLGNDYPLVRFLVEHGCPLNAVNRRRTTALDIAEERASKDIQAYLRSHGAKRASELRTAD